MVDQIVECIFFGKKILNQRRTLNRCRFAFLIKKTDIAARTVSFFATAANHHAMNVCLISPVQQRAGHGADHIECE